MPGWFANRWPRSPISPVAEPRPAQPTASLSRSAHDRAGHRRDQAEWLAAAWPAAQVLLLGDDGTAPVRRDGDAVHLDLRPAREVDESAERTFLGQHDGTAYFSVSAAAPDAEVGGLRDVGDRLDDLDSGLLTSALALANWHRTHHFCPRCGSPTTVTQAGWTRTCRNDGSLHFPRTDPAVIMLVHDGGDRCVLGTQSVWPAGRYSILAGFVEAGESAEAAVVREVGEEVDIAVRDVRYVASQPWPFPSSLMLGYTALAPGAPPLRPDGDEIATAGWFTRDEVRAAATWGDEHSDGGWDVPGDRSDVRLRALPGRLSIARRILDDWLADG